MRLAILSALGKLLRIEFRVNGGRYGANLPRPLGYIVHGSQVYDPRPDIVTFEY